jgi:hypothetical protein
MAKQSQPFQNGTATIDIGVRYLPCWNEVSLSFQKADGTPYTGAMTGSATIEAMGSFADVWEQGANPLDLTTERRWAPFLSGIQAVRITVTGAPADAYCVATLATNW